MKPLERFAVITIFSICSLQIFPAFFKGGDYFDNVYFTNLFFTLSYICISLPLLVKRINPIIRVVSNIMGGWYIASLLFELVNFTCPTIVLNNIDNNFIYPKMLIAFSLAVAFAITSNKWSKQ